MQIKICHIFVFALITVTAAKLPLLVRFIPTPEQSKIPISPGSPIEPKTEYQYQWNIIAVAVSRLY